MAYEQTKAGRRNFWPISSYGAAAGVGGGVGVANASCALAPGSVAAAGNGIAPHGNSDFHFLQASTFLQELIDSNRKRGSVKSPPPPPPPPPPPQPQAASFAPPPPISSGRETYAMEDSRQRLLPPPPASVAPNNAQQPETSHPESHPGGGGNGNGGDQQNWNFMGQKMWPSDKNCQVEEDFRLEYMVEYMELDEFLTENDIPLESVLQDQQGPPVLDEDSKAGSASASSGASSAPTQSTGHQAVPGQQQQQPPHSQNHPPTQATQQPKMGPPLDAASPPINPQSSSGGTPTATGVAVSNSGGQGHMDNLIKSECVGGNPSSGHDYGDYGPGSGGGDSSLPPMGPAGAQLCGGGGGHDKGVISLPPPPPPPPPAALDSSASSLALLRKRKKQMVSEERKDEKYWERRRKNNMAAKRSRDARRAKETQIAIQATLLERENKNLTQELSKARAENLLLRERLQKYEQVWNLKKISLEKCDLTTWLYNYSSRSWKKPSSVPLSPNYLCHNEIPSVGSTLIFLFYQYIYTYEMRKIIIILCVRFWKHYCKIQPNHPTSQNCRRFPPNNERPLWRDFPWKLRPTLNLSYRGCPIILET